MGNPREMMAAHRLSPLVVALIYLSFSAAMEEETGLVEELREEAAVQGSTVTYTMVPGFAMRDGSTVVKGKDQNGCAAVCTGESTCRSYSFRTKDSACLWSTESLVFDPKFTMYVKAEHSSHKVFRTYPGLMYRASGWLKTTGKSRAQCQALCAKSKECKAACYRHADMTCLISAKGVSMSPDFNY